MHLFDRIVGRGLNRSPHAHIGHLAAAALAAALSGCAVVPGPYTQQVDLGGTGALAIDIKQRVVFSHEIPIDKEQPGRGRIVVTCAEPSPDALTVIGTSGAASFSLGNPASPKVFNLSGSASEGGAFTGLRTQSIQLLRDQMYRLCEGYAGGAMDGAEFKAMQRRFQSTVLGLLAIEQLTGPVVAGQALLLSSAQAQAGAGAGDTQVVAAKTALEKANGELLDAQKALIEKQDAVKKDDEDLDAITKELVAANTPLAQPDTLTSLRTRKTELTNTRRSDATALTKAEADLQAKRKIADTAFQELQQAQSKSSSSSDTRGSLQAAIHANQQSSEFLSRAVVGIVNNVNAAYTRDECVELLARIANRPGIDNLSQIDIKLNLASGLQHQAIKSLDAVRGSCTAVIQHDSQERLKEADIRLEQVRLQTQLAMLDIVKAKQAEANASAKPTEVERKPRGPRKPKSTQPATGAAPKPAAKNEEGAKADKPGPTKAGAPAASAPAPGAK